MSLAEEDTWSSELPWCDEAEASATGPLSLHMLKQGEDEDMWRHRLFITFVKADRKTWEGEVVYPRWVTAVKKQGTPDEFARARIVGKQFKPGTAQVLHATTPDRVAYRVMLERLARQSNWCVFTIDAERMFFPSPLLEEGGFGCRATTA